MQSQIIYLVRIVLLTCIARMPSHSIKIKNPARLIDFKVEPQMIENLEPPSMLKHQSFDSRDRLQKSQYEFEKKTTFNASNSSNHHSFRQRSIFGGQVYTTSMLDE